MDIMFFTNNQRKMHGLPLWRKKTKENAILPDVKQMKQSKRF